MTDQTELNDVRQELLSRPDQYITFKDLVERFDDVDAEFNHSPWSLLQIYSNFYILIGEERKEMINCVAHQVCHEDKAKVLDKICADIEHEKKVDFQRNRKTYDKCLCIIDKYKKDSEDKK